MSKKVAAKKKDMCIECAYCGLTVDLYAGSHYTCEKTNKPLPSALLDRQSCAAFIKPKPKGHWGA